MRFLFKVVIDYPELKDEIEIISREHELRSTKLAQITNSIDKAKLISYQEIISDIIVEPKLIEYIASVVVNTRNNPYLYGRIAEGFFSVVKG